MKWIKFDDRLPTKEDADHTGYVITWHKTEGIYVQSVKRLYKSEFTHWSKVDPPKQ